ncbi:MAG: hypothetical protein M1820_006704 [Bogoriella megaspora]|nr:MAG: hypothetical protein M1820_006704 [Bogoriella megaspora]
MTRAWVTVLLALCTYIALLLGVCAAEKLQDGRQVLVGQLTVPEIEQRLQSCPVVESLNVQKAAELSDASSLAERVFSVIFPGSPAVNSLLATLYISGPPNFLLALCPPNIDPSSLSIMVAFAVGGLLGDTLFHLLPEIFLGEDAPDHVRFVMVEPNKNLLLGVATMVGFVTFVAMDKGLRIATGGEDIHDHSHGHTNVEEDKGGAKSSGALPPKTDHSLRSRKKDKDSNGAAVASSEGKKTADTSIKLSGYLNLIADFTHNITDGLALSSSFYASPTVGATTCVAVFFHEIPHEVGDFALLIQSGFPKNKAMGLQFVTALGCVIGTFIGIAVQESGKTSSASGTSSSAGVGLLGTSLSWGDLLLPWTAGTFLYVGTVGVIPELLETGKHRGKELRKTVAQFAAMAAGAGIMLAISWS